MTSTGQAFRSWPWSRRLLIIAAVILLGVGSFSLLRSHRTVYDFCFEMKITNQVEGTLESESPATRATVRSSFFPFGAECSYFAGYGQPRVTSFQDFGTIPITIGVALLCAAAVAHARDATRSRSDKNTINP
jgi:hypothetical protein